MHKTPVGFASLRAGDPVGPLRVTVSDAANERYWQAAGVDHESLRAGALYPPIAANLTVLAFAELCSDPVIQTRQRLVSHRRQAAGAELVTVGHVTDCYTKRGRAYVDITVTVTSADRPDDPLWTSEVRFTPTATLDP